MEETYIARPLLTAGLSGQTALASSLDRRTVTEVPLTLVRILSRCSTLQPLRQHLARVVWELGLDEHQARAAAEDLPKAVAHGLLVSRTELVTTAAGRSIPTAGTPITALGIPTRDRVGALVRCINSYLENARSAGRALTVTVIDGATDDPGRACCRQALADVATRWRADVRYAGAPEKSSWIERLSRAADVDPTIVRFGLLDAHGCGTDTGANRNALLLEHSGRAFLSADDDTVCELRHRPHAPERFAFRSAYDPTEVTLFTDLDEARAAVPQVEGCLLEMHERLLGRPIGGWFASAPSEAVNLEGLTPAFLDVLMSGRATIPVTLTGIFGDCGARYPSFYLWSHGSVVAQLQGDPRYRALAASRQILRAAGAYTASSGAFAMSTCFAVDCTGVMVPFFPVGRGADLNFGHTLRICRDDAFLGHLPWAIGHYPVDARRHRTEALWPPRAARSIMVFISCVLGLSETQIRGAPSGERRLRLLGRHCQELARLHWEELEQLLRPARWQWVTHELGELHRLLQGHDGPGPWRQDLEAFLQTRVEDLEDPDWLIPDNLGATRTREQRITLAQTMLRQFGELLEVWPEITAAARNLSAEGRGLGCPVS